jgi:outer membrane protein with beta-barrel domain
VLLRLISAMTFVVVASAAFAQSSVEGYVTGGGGQWVHNNGSRGSLVVGAGGVEWLPAPYFGIAGEAGALTSFSGDLLFSVGADARVHILGTPGPGEWGPYAFAGYSPLKFFELSDHGPQFGAGVDYRLSRGRALRFEVRDILRRSSSVTSHYWTARLGMTFRSSATQYRAAAR